nr:DUF3363 domain-containing protein [Chelatococcus sp. CO-6]
MTSASSHSSQNHFHRRYWPASDGATWLDRELPSRDRTPPAEAGFGRAVSEAMGWRRQALVDMGHAVRHTDGSFRAPKDLLQRLAQAEIARVGRAMAAERGLAFVQAKPATMSPAPSSARPPSPPAAMP